MENKRMFARRIECGFGERFDNDINALDVSDDVDPDVDIAMAELNRLNPYSRKGGPKHG